MPRTIVCGLDIGTSHVCCAVAERAHDGTQRVIGCGWAEHHGVREGHVIDLDGTTDAIQTALAQAERDAGVTVRQSVVGVSVPEIQTRRGRGLVPLADYGMEVRGRDVERVRAQAELMELALDRAILHSVPMSFSVDGQLGVDDPLGLVGRQLAVELLMLTCPQLVLQNLAKAVQLAGLEVQQFVYSGLATGHGALTLEEREQTILVVDIGGTLTDVVLMDRGQLTDACVLPTGGDTLTAAIQRRAKVSTDEADALKRETVLSRTGPVTRALTEAVTVLLTAYAGAAQRLTPSAGELDGVIITGRTALLDGVLELVEERFAKPVRLGRVPASTWHCGREQSVSALTALALLDTQRSQVALAPMPTEPLPWPRRILVKARELYEDYF